MQAYAAKNPHKMGPWAPDSKTHVATMTEGTPPVPGYPPSPTLFPSYPPCYPGDFYGSEQSATVAAASDVRIYTRNPNPNPNPNSNPNPYPNPGPSPNPNPNPKPTYYLYYPGADRARAQGGRRAAGAQGEHQAGGTSPTLPSKPPGLTPEPSRLTSNPPRLTPGARDDRRLAPNPNPNPNPNTSPRRTR